jgi:hypothetical protein
MKYDVCFEEFYRVGGIAIAWPYLKPLRFLNHPLETIGVST